MYIHHTDTKIPVNVQNLPKKCSESGQNVDSGPIFGIRRDEKMNNYQKQVLRCPKCPGSAHKGAHVQPLCSKGWACWAGVLINFLVFSKNKNKKMYTEKKVLQNRRPKCPFLLKQGIQKSLGFYIIHVVDFEGLLE